MVTAPAWCWGYNQRFRKSYRDEQHRRLPPPPQEKTAVGREQGSEEWKEERPGYRSRGLEPADATSPGSRKEGFCAQSGLAATHRSGVTPSEQAAQGHRESEQTLGEQSGHRTQQVGMRACRGGRQGLRGRGCGAGAAEGSSLPCAWSSQRKAMRAHEVLLGETRDTGD